MRVTTDWIVSRAARALSIWTAVTLAPFVASDARGQVPVPTGWPGAASTRPSCSLTGIVTAGQSGQSGLPGVAISVKQHDAAAAAVATSTNTDGTFSLAPPGPGRYVLSAEFAGFAPVSKELTVDASCQVRIELAMTLASRVAPPARPVGPEVTPPGVPSATVKPRPEATSGLPARAQPSGTGAARFQRVTPAAGIASGAGNGPTDQLGASADDARALAEHLSLPPGFTPETMSDTVTAFGSAGQTNEMMLFGPRGDGLLGGLPGQPGSGEDRLPGVGAAFGPGAGAGGFGGPGGRGGMGGGRPGMAGPGGQRGGLNERLAMANRLRQDQPHGQVSYTVGGSPFDAAPYSLNGQSTQKPDYLQQRLAATIGGQFKIPRLFDLGPRTYYFLNYTGNHSANAYSAYSTVPIAAQRAGDFSSSPVLLVDPLTNLPFAGNRIPANRLSPSAQALLQYIPLPNQDGTARNYYYSTTNTTSADDLNFRFVRTFGATENRRGGRGAGMMGGPAGGGRGGPMGGGTTFNVAIHYHRQTSTQSAAFPTIGGESSQSGWDIPVGFSFTAWHIVHAVRTQFNRSDSTTTNRYAYLANAANDAGITGVAADPFDWGVPNLSFSGFTGLRDITPSTRSTQTLTWADSMMRVYKKHNVRWGVGFKDERLDSRTDSSARGAYTFTGLFTGGSTARLSGADFADFLLGMPQQASVQFGPGLVRFRSQSWSAFAQDDWRVSSNLTLDVGVRYEYQSPYSEAGNRLVDLDVAPGFAAATAVQAGQSGPYTGLYPLTVVEPDLNNFAPRIGLAWRPQRQVVIRGGYGINYSSVPYLSIAQKLAAQPPFATTDTRIGTVTAPLSLSNAFGTPSTATTTNNFGVDPSYQIGYVHLWNVDVQREFGRTLSAGISYTGTKGRSLDMLRAPNRGSSGLLMPGVQAFIWESSGAESILHALSLRVRKRLARGLSFGGVYTLSKSRDNASTLGGGGGVVAQNDKDLDAEWGLSSFDQRHRFTGDFSLELPFGTNRRWLNEDGAANILFGGWALAGTVSLSSGQPFTARVAGAVSDVAGGVNGTLRANYNGQPVALDNPTLQRFFNTSAFSVPPAGTFGTSQRNMIIGPGSRTLNMGLVKSFPIRGTRGLMFRVQANNVLNTPVWAAIDTVVNSPTFGQVVSVRPMRSVQLVVRLMF